MSEPVWRTAADLAPLFGVKPATIRMWAYRGHTVRRGDLYDENALRDWWDNHRDTRMDAVRRGVGHDPDQVPRERTGVTTSQAAHTMGVNPRTLRLWAQRGWVRRYGRDLYDAGDVANQWRRLAFSDHFAPPGRTSSKTD